MITVREYRSTDFARLVEMGRRFHAASDFHRFAYEPHELFKLSEAVESHPDLCGFVAEMRGEIIGMFVGGVTSFFFSTVRYGFDLCLFVDEGSRGGKAAMMLIARAAGWCRANGAQQMRFGAATGIEPERTDRFFRHMGFERGGVLYVKDLP
jgi:GNAT superfamily N-acetyltransferase